MPLRMEDFKMRISILALLLISCGGGGESSGSNPEGNRPRDALIYRLFRREFSRRAFSKLFGCVQHTRIVCFLPDLGPFPEFQAQLSSCNSNNFFLTM